MVITLLAAVIALVVLGLAAMTSSLLRQGPRTTSPVASTTAAQAKATSLGRSPEGSNTSQDAYTAQNQSQNPPDPPR